MSVKKINGKEIAGVKIEIVSGLTGTAKVFAPRAKKEGEAMLETVQVPEVPEVPATEKEAAIPAVPAHDEQRATEYFKVPLENDNCYRLRDLAKKEAKTQDLGGTLVKFTYVDADRAEVATEENDVDLALTTISGLKW
jgi:hypothetical protein